MSLRRLGSAVVDRALASNAGDALEGMLVRLGHRWPDPDLPWGSAIRAALRRRQRDGDLWARLTDGTEMRVPAIPEMFALYLSGRPPDPEVWRLIRRLVQPGDVVLDAGANVGVHTIAAARSCGPSGRVHAFEPQSDLARRIEESARANGVADRVAVHDVAVGETAAEDVCLHTVAGRPDLVGVPSLVRHEWLDSTGGARVRAVTLDSVVAREGEAPSVVKLDIEGGELAALRGFETTLRRSPPDFILSEVLPRRMRFSSIRRGAALARGEGSTEPADLVGHLEERGYLAHEVLADGRVGRRRRARDVLHDLGETSTDLVFARHEGRAERPWVFA